MMMGLSFGLLFLFLLLLSRRQLLLRLSYHNDRNPVHLLDRSAAVLSSRLAVMGKDARPMPELKS